MNQAISRFFTLFFLACVPIFLFATDGYKIRVKLENYKNDTLLLGYHYGDKQYLKDTAIIGKDGFFTLEDTKTLECGVYLLVLKPDNQFVQVLISDNNQDFTINVDAKEPVKTFKVKGSADNEYFYEYLQWLEKERTEADGLRAKLTDKSTSADSAKATKRLTEIDEEVKAYQLKLTEKYPNTMTGKIVRSAMEQKIPDMTGDEKEQQMKRYSWYKAHYFDNIDLSDPCMLRSPVLHQRMIYYVDKLTVQHPDSIGLAIDLLLKKCEKAEETYKFYLIHYLNFYAKSNLVGMDAVYVHIADQYYCQGKAKWAKKEDLDKICDNAARLRPILLGKIAPNIQCEDRTGTKFNLYDVDAEYTVLWFWAWDCGHCKKSSPFMIDFMKKWQPKGVKIFAVCTALTDKTGECWKEIDAREFNDHFINVVDPYIRSNYKTLYDVRSTPQLFILNKKHEIIMKKVASEQLEEVMTQVIEMEELKKKDGIKK
jgi:thiol-disulfide isomerase/thioredoxin